MGHPCPSRLGSLRKISTKDWIPYPELMGIFTCDPVEGVAREPV